MAGGVCCALIKAAGWRGYSANRILTPLANMGQILFEPPDVSGWRLGSDWFSTGTLLARMNFASAVATNQMFEFGQSAMSSGATPESLLAYVVERLAPARYSAAARNDLLDYLDAGGEWTGDTTQVRVKAAGLVHLVGGSSEFQFV